MKPSGIGGQAVLEGVMMKNGKEYAVAVRKPDGQIEIKKDIYEGITSKSEWFRKPFIRGMFNFIESMSLGMDIINYSASFYEEESEAPKSEEEQAQQKKKDDTIMGITMVFSVVLAIGLLMLLPTWLGGLLKKWLFLPPPVIC